ncbi:MAG: hypothetical protein RBR26_07405 [Methanosarcina mazei]|jgi:hypothetical protein|nr:hypothetical protein [Methanosarcina mazei]
MKKEEFIEAYKALGNKAKQNGVRFGWMHHTSAEDLNLNLNPNEMFYGFTREELEKNLEALVSIRHDINAGFGSEVDFGNFTHTRFFYGNVLGLLIKSIGAYENAEDMALFLLGMAIDANIQMLEK